MAANETSSQPSSSWDEAQCIAALAQLEHLQGQLDDLRLTIHRAMQPLSAPPKDVSLVWSTYKQAVAGSQSNIESFHEQWNSQDIRSIFEHGKESLRANADLSASAQVPRYGWKQAEPAKPKTILPRKRRHSLIEDIPGHVEEGEMGSIIEGFRSKYPHIKVETKNKNHDITVQLVMKGTKLKFHIVVGQGANDRGKLRAECLGTTELQTAISRCIASRPRPNDLQSLLDIIAAYKTVNATACAKCNRLHDGLGQEPAARRSKQAADVDNPLAIIWEALHESCLD